MKLKTLDDLLQDQLRDLYSAEAQVLKGLQRMIRKVGTDSLRQAFETHRLETRGQVERLRKVARLLGMRLTGKKCKAMEGMLREGKEVMKMKGEPEILDAALIAIAQRIEHYEISAYGTARTLAELLGQQEAVDLLRQTLDEESATDEKLTAIATGDVYPHVKRDEETEEAVMEGAGQETVTAVS